MSASWALAAAAFVGDIGAVATGGASGESVVAGTSALPIAGVGVKDTAPAFS